MEVDTDLESRNAAFADAIGKVLSSEPKKKRTKDKSIILVKAIKDAELRRKLEKAKPTTVIEVVDEEGNIKQLDEVADHESGQVSAEVKSGTHKTLDTVVLPTIKKQKAVIGARLRIKPDTRNNERERELNAIATKGVVHLFNTVRQQQMKINEMLEKAGPSETKKDKALAKFSKKDFLDKLKGDKTEKKPKTECWKVLKDDFLMGTDSKNWDHQSEEEDLTN